MRQKPEIVSAETIARTRIFRVEQVELRFSNGVQVCYERLRSNPRGAVLIVPMLDAETVLLVREYAAGVHRYELGLPKGRIEEGEAPEQAADREMQEEIGYGARSLRTIASLTVAPGYLSHVTHIVLARDLYEQRLPGDEPEEMEVVPCSLREIDRLLEREDFTEARSIAALYMTRELLAREATGTDRNRKE